MRFLVHDQARRTRVEVTCTYMCAPAHVSSEALLSAHPHPLSIHHEGPCILRWRRAVVGRPRGLGGLQLVPERGRVESRGGGCEFVRDDLFGVVTAGTRHQTDVLWCPIVALAAGQERARPAHASVATIKDGIP